MSDTKIVHKSSPHPLMVKAKESTPDGDILTVEGYVTTYGNIDRDGDIVEKGSADGFLKDFNEDKSGLQMLYQHQRGNIIGKFTQFKSDDYGIKGTGEIFTDVTQGGDVAKLINKGMLDSFSIGFNVKDFELMDNGGFLFKEIDLFEVSIVDVPANPRATIQSVKRDDGSLDMKLLERQLRDAGLSRSEAKTVLSGINTKLRDVAVDKTKSELYSSLLNKLNGGNS